MAKKKTDNKKVKAAERKKAEELEELERDYKDLEDAEDDFGELEDEDEQPRREKGKKKKAKKSKGFPFGGLMLMLLLIGMILAGSYYGLQYYEQLKALEADYDGRVAAAEADLSAAQAEYAEADPDSEAHTAERRQVTEEMIAAAKAELAEQQALSDETDAAMSEAQDRLKELENVEGFDYYKAIYDEYVEGREFVESLLSDH